VVVEQPREVRVIVAFQNRAAALLGDARHQVGRAFRSSRSSDKFGHPTEPGAGTLLLRDEAAKGAFRRSNCGPCIEGTRTSRRVALGENRARTASFGRMPEVDTRRESRDARERFRRRTAFEVAEMCPTSGST